MSQMKRFGVFGPTAIAIAVAALATPWTAQAQQAPEESQPAAQTQPADQTPAVQRVEITGSRIKRVDQEGVSPIQTLTAEDIQRSGATTVTEVLRNLPQAAGGGMSNFDGSNSFSAGASTVSLRSLGSQSTLVLLNGRRIAPFAPADPNAGQASVVNIDTLPLEVVERIEVLPSGASAIYGSDAVAGVINIVTKREFEGGLVEVTGSENNRGKFRTASGSLTYGFGSLDDDGYNIFANVEVSKRASTSFDEAAEFLLDERFSASRFYPFLSRGGSSYAGNYYDAVFNPDLSGAFYYAHADASPNCPPEQLDTTGTCRYDTLGATNVFPSSDRANLFVSGNFKLGEDTTAFVELGYNRNKTFYTGAPQVYGDIGSWVASATSTLVNIPEVLPVGHPSNPYPYEIGYRHRFTEVGQGDSDAIMTATRLVAGVRGLWGDWDYETALTYSSNDYSTTTYNMIRRSVLTDGVLNGTYNFLDPWSGAITPDDLRIDTTDKAKSSFTMLDVSVSREFGQLPGGPIGMALGAEARHESRNANPDVAKTTGEVVGFGSASAEGTRNVMSAYAEFSLPVIKDLEVQLAGRVDRYSDYGTSFNPKLAANWKISPAFSVRGGIETGFRAPSLTEIAKSSVSAFTGVTDPYRCFVDPDYPDDGPICETPGIGLLIEATPNLEPEKSRGFSLGFVVEPLDGLSLSMDYFDIRRRNEVTTIDLDEILRNEFSGNPFYAGRVIRGPVDPDHPDAPGPIQVIKTGYINASETKTAGFDLDARYGVNMGELGKLNVSGKLTYYTKYEFAFSSDTPALDYVGYYNQPKWRGSIGVDWEYQAANIGLTLNSVAGYKPFNPDPTLPDDAAICADDPTLLGICRVGSWSTLDLSMGAEITEGLDVALTIRNLTDRKPPVDPIAYYTPLFNADLHSGYGRMFTLSASYKF